MNPLIHYPLLHWLVCSSFFLLWACSPELPEEVADAYGSLPKHIDFNLHVKPILSDKCFACHGPDQENREAGLRLDLASAALGELPESPGKRAIVPGNPEKSEMFHRLLSRDPDISMPPPEFKVELSNEEKAVLVKWIEEGAEYKQHWAFIPPKEPSIPQVKHTDRVSNPIDQFVLRSLEAKGLSMSPRAERELLLRRLSFDATGLPPSLEEIQAFVEDESRGCL